MEIMDYEIKRHTQWSEDVSHKKVKDSSRSDEAKAEKRFITFVAKQEQALRVSIYLLLNLSEDTKVEEKMAKKNIVPLLAALLERKNQELLILVVSFMKKLSCYVKNKEEMKNLNVVDKLAQALLATEDNFDLVNATVRYVKILGKSSKSNFTSQN